MATLAIRVEGQNSRLAFHFSANMGALAYDQSAHYQSLQPRPMGVDIVASRLTAQPEAVWLVEVKDFRTLAGVPKAESAEDLAPSVKGKVEDTLKALASWPESDSDYPHANRAKQAFTRRVVLHLEPHAGTSKLFSVVPSAANVRQRLVQLLKDVDSNPLVLNMANTKKAEVPWSVTPE